MNSNLGTITKGTINYRLNGHVVYRQPNLRHSSKHPLTFIMASKILKKKNDSRDNSLNLFDVKSDDICPMFDVQYLGKMPARGEFGREFVAEPVESLLKMKDRGRLSNSKLTISERGFHFLDHNGPFGKEKHVIIPIHHICYGVVDDQNPKVFAIIAKSDSTAEGSLYECHAYLCGRRRVASEITKWLLRTFLQVFDKLQQRRRIRLERKARKEQKMLAKAIGLPEGRPSFAPSEASTPQSPTTSTSSSFSFEETTFSVLLEGKKNHGAAIRIARQRPASLSQGNVGQRNSQIPLGRSSTWNTSRNPHSSVPTTLNPQDLQTGAEGGYHPSSHYSTFNPGPYVRINERHKKNKPIASQPVMHPRSIFPKSNQRQYLKKRANRNRSTSNGSSNASRLSDSVTSPVQDESEFVFIDMLQEHVTSMDLQSISEHESVTTYGSSGNPVDPLKQQVRIEDVERRIRDWLLGDKDESPDESSSYSYSVFQSGQAQSKGQFRYF